MIDPAEGVYLRRVTSEDQRALGPVHLVHKRVHAAHIPISTARGVIAHWGYFTTSGQRPRPREGPNDRRVAGRFPGMYRTGARQVEGHSERFG